MINLIIAKCNAKIFQQAKKEKEFAVKNLLKSVYPATGSPATIPGRRPGEASSVHPYLPI